MTTTIHSAQRRGHRGDYEALCGAEVNDNLAFDRSGITCWKCVHLVMGRPIPAEPVMTEHDKLTTTKHEGRDATQLIGDFLEWLGEQSIVLALYDKYDNLYPTHGTKERLLAEFFGINENALEAEKLALLEYQRAYSKAVDWAEKEGRPYLAKNP